MCILRNVFLLLVLYILTAAFKPIVGNFPKVTLRSLTWDSYNVYHQNIWQVYKHYDGLVIEESYENNLTHSYNTIFKYEYYYVPSYKEIFYYYNSSKKQFTILDSSVVRNELLKNIKLKKNKSSVKDCRIVSIVSEYNDVSFELTDIEQHNIENKFTFDAFNNLQKIIFYKADNSDSSIVDFYYDYEKHYGYSYFFDEGKKILRSKIFLDAKNLTKQEDFYNFNFNEIESDNFKNLQPFMISTYFYNDQNLVSSINIKRSGYNRFLKITHF